MAYTPNPKPEVCTDEHMNYLDELKATGVVNMYGAGVYLERKFKVNQRDARAILRYWMETYPERHPEDVNPIG